MILSHLIFRQKIKSTYDVVFRSALDLTVNYGFLNFLTYFGTASEDDKVQEIKLPEEPQNCCMSGCANCVWIAYAEELAKILNDGGETAKQKIIEHVKDPNLRAFLMLELSHLFEKKK